MTEIGGRDPPRQDGPAPRRYDGDTAAARVRVAVFVRSEKSNALVGDGVLQPAPRSANLDSAFGGMHLNATEAWRAAPLLLTHTLHRCHSLLCGCHSCDSDGLALTGPQSLVLRGLCERHCSATAGTL